jgi:glycosyltransferase involved in cell wall biosynthesis
VTAVSGYVAHTLPLDSVTVIPNFVESSAKEAARPDEVPDRYLLFVGKLEPGKAADRLPSILEKAKTNLPLLIAGTGRLEAELARSGRNVRMLGWVDEGRVGALVRHAAAVLFPSRWQEPLSRVLLDAMAAGAVIVAEPTGGTAEMVVDGESGLLARGDEDLGRALVRVLEDSDLAHRLREGARRRARTLFSEEAVLPAIESLYRSVADA